MAGAVVLGFIWLRDNLAKAGDSLSDKLEIGKNSAGLLQVETTKEIEKMEKQTSGLLIRWTNCKRGKAYYASVADDIWTECKANYSTDEAKMFELLTPLNADELKAVAQAFGVRETSLLGLATLGSYTIVKALKAALSDGYFSNDETNMRRIWAKTGLW